MPKKKTSKKSPSEIPSLEEKVEVPTKPIPTFVTEVIENDDGNGEIEAASVTSGSEVKSDKLEEILNDFEEKNENRSSDKETVIENEIKSVKDSRIKEDLTEAEASLPEDTEISDSETTINQKQVVEELFTRKDTGLTEISIGRKKHRSVFLWGLIMLAAAVTTGFGLLFFSGMDKDKITIIPQPNPTATPVPTTIPSPTPEIKKSDFSVQILNGGGVPGAASKMKSFLVEKGYSVLDVGNTEDYSYEETTIRTKQTKSAIIPFTEADLSEEYIIGTSSSDLEEDSEYDLQIIVGKK